jgi:hypothetical protein
VEQTPVVGVEEPESVTEALASATEPLASATAALPEPSRKRKWGFSNLR